MMILKGKFNQAFIHAETIEPQVINQIKEFLNTDVSEGSTIHIMPDTHSGKGCVVGFTMTILDKLCPNLVGVDVGCFHKDTKVKLTDGRDVSFEDLVVEAENGKEHYGYSLDKDGHVRVSKLVYPRKIKTVDETVIVTLDNGEKIQCTLDHIFYKRNMKEVEAKDLKVGDSLYPLYLKKRNELDDDERCSLDSNLMGKDDDHLCVYDVVDNSYHYVHHLSDDFNYRNGLIKKFVKSFVRHHVDFDKFNNDPTNIVRMSLKEHWHAHCDNVSYLNKMGVTGTKRIEAKYGREKLLEICSNAGKLGGRATWSGEKAEEVRKHNSESLTKWNKSEIAREQARLRQKLHNTSKFDGPDGIRNEEWFKMRVKLGKLRKIFKIMNERGLDFTEENYNTVRPEVYNGYVFSKAIEIMNETHLTFQDILNGMVNKNHRVVSIEHVKGELDVYCLTCPEFGNFALSSGVFVHNCQMTCIKLPKGTKIEPGVFLEACKKIPNGVGANAGKPPKFVNVDSIGLDKLTFELNHSETVINSIGSLGSGNHFIELNEDRDTGDHYIVVHTGSRNLGQQVCGYHMRVAKTDHSRGDLSYLTGHNLDNYLHDMKICQNYALSNHKEIYSKLLELLGVRLCKTEVFTTMHNYIDFNDHILRKGAISCQEGKKVLIPFNMRDGSVIGIGKGNPEWNFSGPHGAGRILSRTQAKQLITLEDFKESMKGITGTVCKETIDEAPMVYKKADEIERLISETVEVTNHLKVLANFKGF